VCVLVFTSKRTPTNGEGCVCVWEDIRLAITQRDITAADKMDSLCTSNLLRKTKGKLPTSRRLPPSAFPFIFDAGLIGDA
jgi:hypothetical protein